jgi:hypothetical protein
MADLLWRRGLPNEYKEVHKQLLIQEINHTSLLQEQRLGLNTNISLFRLLYNGNERFELLRDNGPIFSGGYYFNSLEKIQSNLILLNNLREEVDYERKTVKEKHCGKIDTNLKLPGIIQVLESRLTTVREAAEVDQQLQDVEEQAKPDC